MLTIYIFLVVIFNTVTCKTIDIVKTTEDFHFGNIAKTSEGHVLQKNESLLSRTSSSSEDECWLKCVEDPVCLSMNVIPLSDATYLCEMFNWTGTNLSGLQVPKQKSYHATIQGVCYNGGTCLQFNSNGCKCACLAGYKGSYCEMGPYQDCAALQSAGFQSSGIYEIDPDGKGRFQVYCDMISEGGGWTVIHKRFDGSFSFNHNWNQYKTGFGDMKNGEFWLGNDYIHRLTAARPAIQLYIPLENANGLKFYAKYSRFSVAGESDLYRLSVSGYSGTAGDALSHTTSSWRSNGMAFSTPDRDNDRAPVFCASERKVGWWFNYCGAGILNEYPMIWLTLNPNTMKKGAMKIKPSS